MERRGCAPRSVTRFQRDARRLCEYTGWATVDQLALAGAIEYLGAQRAGGWSGTTHDAVASAIRSWGAFLAKVGAVLINPFEHLESTGEQGEPGARALTTEEARAIIAAACRPERRGRAKCPRSLFYLFLCLTGLRTAEATACRWKDIDLEGDPPAIYTDPRWAKNKTRMRVVLAPELLTMLRGYRASVPYAPADRVFPSVPNRHSWAADRERAGVRAEDGRGRAATFHSCRKWLATQLDAQGVTPGVVARIIRHADGLTQKKYIDPPAGEEVSAISGLPRLWPEQIPNPIAMGARKTLDTGPEGADAVGATPNMNPAHTPISDSASRDLGQLGRSVSQLCSGGSGSLDVESAHSPLGTSPVSHRAITHGNGQSRVKEGACEIDAPSGDVLESLGTLADRLGPAVTLRDVLTIARWAREERADGPQL